MVSTRMVGGDSSGYCSMDRRCSTARPSRVDDDRDDDGDGRPPDEEVSHGSRSGGWSLAPAALAAVGRTFAPSRTFCRPSTTIRSAGSRPSEMTQSLPTRLAGLMARILRDAVGAHHEDVVGPLELLHRPLRDHDRVLAGGDRKPHPAELSGPEEPAGIGKRGLHGQRAGLGTDSPSDYRDPALLRVDRSVGEHQLELGTRAAALAGLRAWSPARRSGTRPRRW